MKASHVLKANAGEHLGAIIRDSLGHELGRQALDGVTVQSREVPIYDEDGEALDVVTQYYARLHIVTDDDVNATVRLHLAARALLDHVEGRQAPFYDVPADLIDNLRRAIK
jgi:hypothetical protein